jgi:hypothetical protein
VKNIHRADIENSRYRSHRFGEGLLVLNRFSQIGVEEGATSDGRQAEPWPTMIGKSFR